MRVIASIIVFLVSVVTIIYGYHVHEARIFYGGLVATVSSAVLGAYIVATAVLDAAAEAGAELIGEMRKQERDRRRT